MLASIGIVDLDMRDLNTRMRLMNLVGVSWSASSPTQERAIGESDAN